MSWKTAAAMKKALTDGGFFDRTPLWFYILKESEVKAKGSSLGEVGSIIVAETIIGHILNDSESYLNVFPGVLTRALARVCGFRTALLYSQL